MNNRDSVPLTSAARPSYFAAIGAILKKDLATEFRNRELIISMGTFALLVILIFNFSLELNVRDRSTVTAGVLWVTFIFAGTLGLSRSMSLEKERGCLDGLLLMPIDRTAIYFGKMIGNLIFMLIVELLILPLYSIFYNENLFNPGLLLVLLLGSIGYVTVGTLIATMTVHTRTKEILFPILHLPIVFPILLPAVRASTYFLQDYEMSFITPQINFLIAFDLIYISLAYMLFEFIVED